MKQAKHYAIIYTIKNFTYTHGKVVYILTLLPLCSWKMYMGRCGCTSAQLYCEKLHRASTSASVIPVDDQCTKPLERDASNIEWYSMLC